MKHLELHIIQSVPVSCLNRDDLGSPKTAVFGGTTRARVSSQSWKRAIREYAKELSPDLFKGNRTKLLYAPLYESLLAKEIDPDEAKKGATEIVDALAKVDSKSKDEVKVKTLYFMSPLEIETLASVWAETKDVKKSLKAVKGESLKDAADISLFGRMVASDTSLNVEAASMFAHALSTHKVDNEIDFFSAVDDLRGADSTDAGAGMIGTLEYNSATYYRFAALNLDMLADQNHLASLSKNERQEVVRSFIHATIMAMPTARKFSMNGNTLPCYVLGIVRDKGHPIQLVNAFEEPVRSSSGYAAESINRLQGELAKLKKVWGVDSVFEKAVPDIDLNGFVEGMVAHVI
jgi:CRISPR system Cascade subunit CasC